MIQIVSVDGTRQQWDLASGYTAFDAAGNVTQQRVLTSDETAAVTADNAASQTAANGGTLRSRAQAALTTNATYLAIGSPTNVQVVAQVQALTKECSALIRLLIGQLDSISGT